MENQAGDGAGSAGSGTLSPLGSDCSDGPSRLVADPDSPTSRLLERAARRSLASSQRNTPEKFSFLQDIVRNPDIARAARRALASSASPSAGGGGGGDGPGGGPSGIGSSAAAATNPALLLLHPELEHQATVIAQLDADAAQGSELNQQMAGVVLGRLQRGRQAAERTLGVLQAFAAAEAAYARAMSAVAKLTLCSEADGPTLRAAMLQFSDVPQMMGSSHSAATERLQSAIRGMHSLVSDLRGACEEVGLGAARAKREVDASRAAVKAALRAHREACEAFEPVAAAAHQRQRQAGRADPWLTEGCLVEQQVRLQRSQHIERQYLAAAFRRVGDLEQRRATVVQGALQTFVAIYRAQVVPIQEIADELAELLRQIDATADLEAFSDTAARSVQSGEALSARQQDAADRLCQKLLGSAEIVRQGDLERWDSVTSRWQRTHLVMTRAGFLHLFPPDSAAAREAAGRPGSAGGGSSGSGNGAAEGDGTAASGEQLWWGGASSWAAPQESLNLSRCSFEPGEAPVFRITELPGGGGALAAGLALFGGGGRARPQTLRAGSVEQCMDWVSAVREAIAGGGAA